MVARCTWWPIPSTPPARPRSCRREATSTVGLATPAMNGLPVQRIDVNLGTRSYPIHIGAGVMENAAELVKAIPARDVLLVTNTTVGPLYAARLTTALAPRRVIEVSLPDGEIHKTLANVSRILDVLVTNRFARDA